MIGEILSGILGGLSYAFLGWLATGIDKDKDGIIEPDEFNLRIFLETVFVGVVVGILAVVYKIPYAGVEALPIYAGSVAIAKKVLELILGLVKKSSAKVVTKLKK